MSDGWFKVTYEDGVVEIYKDRPMYVEYMTEMGHKVEPVVILTVEEHARLQHAVDALEVLKKFRGIIRD